jgi:uncharacterized membrane protein YjjP (DUF1212 family)
MKQISIASPSKAELEQHKVKIHSLLDEFIGKNSSVTSGVEESQKLPIDLIQSIEDFIIQISDLYKNYGCPTHVLESTIPAVASGLGLTVELNVLPSFILINTKQLDSSSSSSKNRTNFIISESGYNIYKLQLCDELCQRIASYASLHPPCNTTKLIGLIEQHEQLPSKILDLASYGWGFFSAGISKGKALVDENNSELIYSVAFAKAALQDATLKLMAIESASSLNGPIQNIVLNGLAAAGCAGLFFNGTWVEIGLSLPLGMVVSGTRLLRKEKKFGNLLGFLGAFLASLISRLVGHITPICFHTVTISSIVWSLQGLSLTMSVVEILTGTMMSGAVRLISSLIVSALLGFGLELGTSIYIKLLKIPEDTAAGMNSCSSRIEVSYWYYFLLYPVTILSFITLLGAHHSQYLPMLVVLFI